MGQELERTEVTGIRRGSGCIRGWCEILIWVGLGKTEGEETEGVSVGNTH